MAECPHCRKDIDPLATRCRHCRGEIQLAPFQPAATTFYSTVMAPALGAGLMSFIFGMLSPFTGFALRFLLGRATDGTLGDCWIGFDSLFAVGLLAMALSALCGWLCYTIDSVLLSLLSFCTPLLVPPVLILGVQIARVAGSL